MSLIYVTGGDANFFIPAIVLRESLAKHSDIPLMMADFGLTKHQRAYLSAHGWLLEAPQLDLAGHAWNGKAALGEYVDTTSGDTIVWLDADTLVLGDIDSEIERTMTANKDAALFTTPDFGCPDLATFLGRFNPPGFTAELESQSTDLSLPYLNSGVFMCRDNGFLVAWREVNERLDDAEVLFEQNAFNVAAREDDRLIELLDSEHWNLHGDALGAISVDVHDDRPHVSINGDPVLIVHATSEDGRHHITNKGSMDMEKRELPFFMKWFRNEGLKDYQYDLLVGHINANYKSLIDHGVIQPKLAL